MALRPFHTSLRDFLTTEARSEDLFVSPPTCHLSLGMDCLAVMTVHHVDNDFYDLRVLKFAARSWWYHLLCAIKEEGGDDHLFSQHGPFTMKILTDFVSQSFDSWVNSIIFQEKVQDTLENLKSLLLKLKVSALQAIACKVK